MLCVYILLAQSLKLRGNNFLDVRKIAEHPPDVPFHGKNLMFKTEFISYTSEHPRLEHRASGIKRLSDIPGQ